MVERVGAVVARTAPFSILLGGTHAVSIGALRAHAARGRPDEVTIVQIDAHLDMRDDDSDYNDRDPSRYAHSCVMRRARELGFQTCSVGIRAYSREEHLYAVAERCRYSSGVGTASPRSKRSSARLRPSGSTSRSTSTASTPRSRPRPARRCRAVSPGPTAPGCCVRCSCAKDVIGADIVEVAPVPGSGLTEYAAAQLCYDILCYKLLKRDGQARLRLSQAERQALHGPPCAHLQRPPSAFYCCFVTSAIAHAASADTLGAAGVRSLTVLAPERGVSLDVRVSVPCRSRRNRGQGG